MKIQDRVVHSHSSKLTAGAGLGRAALVVLACAPLLCAAADQDPQATDASSASAVPKAAMQAAVADGVTTALALAGGAVEMNPLVPTSPLGLVGLTGAKVLLVKYAETLPEEDKRTVMKSTSGLWGGAAMNNLMVLLGAPPPVPLFAGAIMGVLAWRHAEKTYAEEDRIAALRKAPVRLADSDLPALDVPPLAPAATIALALDEATGAAVAWHE